MQGAYQQAPTTVVIVQQPNTWYRGPNYMRSGVRVCGIVFSLPIIICLGFSGFMLLFSGITTISMANSVPDSIFDDDDVNPGAVVGTMLIIGGVLCLAGCIVLIYYSKKQYQNLNSGVGSDPGRVIRRNPSPSPQPPGSVQPGGFSQPIGGYPPASYPPAGGQMAYPPAGGQMAYPPAGGQMAYPPAGGQMAYPPAGGQNYVYTPPTTAPYGAGPPYPQGFNDKPCPPPYSAVDPGSQATAQTQPLTSPSPTLPCAPEYSAPPPYAPDYKAPL
ncbi:uncharacterized protein [Palaemon carinicauda]|uniref:uncharacterized protein n=1 Tax=Palaemon carinicauda TaxID=392227 RepID=UPI0035B5EC23